MTAPHLFTTLLGSVRGRESAELAETHSVALKLSKIIHIMNENYFSLPVNTKINYFSVEKHQYKTASIVHPERLLMLQINIVFHDLNGTLNPQES